MIHIVGAGWYGCYIAKYLISKKIKYTLWEEKDIFSGASGFNQNRLHLGFHYPRCFSTRYQSRSGFILFEKHFKNLTFKIPKNYYSIHSKSIIDFQTYTSIMGFEEYKFKEISIKNLPVSNLEGAIEVGEHGICPEKSKKYWQSQNLNIIKKAKIKLTEKGLFFENKLISSSTDKIIDCTWGALQNTDPNHFIENMMVLRLKKKRDLNFGALTIMDGPFFSIYPESEKNNFFTLTCVTHGKIPRYQTSKDSLNKIAKKNLSYISSIYKDFYDDFSYIDFYVGRKFKMKSFSDDRSLHSNVHDNVLTIFSGKIDAVFYTDLLVDKFLSI